MKKEKTPKATPAKAKAATPVAPATPAVEPTPEVKPQSAAPEPSPEAPPQVTAEVAEKPDLNGDAVAEFDGEAEVVSETPGNPDEKADDEPEVSDTPGNPDE